MNRAFQRRLDFSDVSLYGVTPESKDARWLLDRTEQVLAGGGDAIQLRCRSLSDRALVELGRQMKALCSRFGALFIVNNRPEIALATGADGVHVGHEDLPVAFVREMMGHRKIIGVSTHAVPEAIEAQKQGADYVSCGPVWATPTKPEYPAVGAGLIGLYRAALHIPFVVIGGLDETNIDEVVSTGAKSVAVVRALYNADDPKAAASFFREKVQINRLKSVV